MNPRSVGVEEELLLVEPETGRPQAVAGTALRAAADTPDLGLELQNQQLETNSRPCHSLSDLHREVRRCRSAAAAAAGQAGAQVVALATSPLAVEPELADDGRYRRMSDAFGLTAHEQLTGGCHVHVEISSPEEGVAVLDRIGPWLATLLALSANSPFWQGRDSEYASFRYQAWGRWPCSGPTSPFGTIEKYRETLRQMVDSGTLLDTGMVYFDARLSEHHPTLEIRIADVCLHAEDAVLIAALARALVETEARADRPAGQSRTELLRLAAWRASRSGLDDVLLSPVTGRPEPAPDVAHALLEHCRDALEDTGDTAIAAELLAGLLARGNGAAFQRAAYRQSGRLPDMIGQAAALTANGRARLPPRSMTFTSKRGRIAAWRAPAPRLVTLSRAAGTGGTPSLCIVTWAVPKRATSRAHYGIWTRPRSITTADRDSPAARPRPRPGWPRRGGDAQPRGLLQRTQHSACAGK